MSSVERVVWTMKRRSKRKDGRGLCARYVALHCIRRVGCVGWTPCCQVPDSSSGRWEDGQRWASTGERALSDRRRVFRPPNGSTCPGPGPRPLATRLTRVNQQRVHRSRQPARSRVGPSGRRGWRAAVRRSQTTEQAAFRRRSASNGSGRPRSLWGFSRVRMTSV